MLRDEASLLDIVQAAIHIQEFLGEASKSEFLNDAKTQSSILYQLLVVGEAVKRLSSDFRKEHDHVPWSLIAGMRDHLIHAYDAVDWEEVWQTITNDIPMLKRQIEPLLPKQPD